MFEKMNNRQEDELFLTSGQIEIDIAIRKEKRKEDQENLALMLKNMLEKRDLGDPDFIRNFSDWQKTEQEAVSEIADPNEYAEEQTRYLVREAEIFAEPGCKYNKADLINEALNRLEGTEEEGYYNGALYDAQNKVETGKVDKVILELIELKIDELNKMLNKKI